MQTLAFNVFRTRKGFFPAFSLWACLRNNPLTIVLVWTQMFVCLQTNPDSFEHGLTLSNFELSLRKGRFDRRTSTACDLFAFLAVGLPKFSGILSP